MALSMQTRAACGVLLLALAIAPAGAQIESGRVIDDSTKTPLSGTSVALQMAASTEWTNVETTHTDAQGFFQFLPHAPGIYRVAFVGKHGPTFLGAPDTLAADSMQQREFQLPITRRSAASAYTADEVEHPARQITGPSTQPDRASMHLASAAGEVNVRFIVETDGHVDPSTLHVDMETDESRVESISRTMLAARFDPATIGGIPVRQIVTRKLRYETRIERVERGHGIR